VKTRAKCRKCGVVQNVVLRKRTDDIKGASITGVPCFKCKEHKLQRARKTFWSRKGRNEMDTCMLNPVFESIMSCNASGRPESRLQGGFQRPSYFDVRMDARGGVYGE
jgi:hypothetical protein